MEQDDGDAGIGKYTCNSIIAIDKIRKKERDEEIQVSISLFS